MPSGEPIFRSTCCMSYVGSQKLIFLVQNTTMSCLDVSSSSNQWSDIKLNLDGEVLNTKMGMTCLQDSSLLLFGGETQSEVVDSDKTLLLYKSSNQSYSAKKSAPLPTPCTPASTSYMLNNSSFYYFLSNEGYVYRLNKIEMQWSKW